MAMTKIFDSWSFNRPLPEPFLAETDRTKKDTTDVGCLSVHNHMSRGKRATLHAASLRAIMAVCDIMDDAESGALGVRSECGTIAFYCGEYTKTNGAVQERRAIVYYPENGKWNGVVRSQTTLLPFPQIGNRGISGTEMLMVLVFASRTAGPLLDAEFAAAFEEFKREKDRGFSDMEKAMKAAFLCCDNLYRRVENRDALGTAGIPFDNDCIASGNIPLITTARLKNGFYAPNEVRSGVFQILAPMTSHASCGTIGDLKMKYNRNFEVSALEKEMIPSLPDNYSVPEEVLDIVEAVVHTPMRVFMAAGESGTGKTTNAKMVAQLLGMPYYFFTCGEGTDEVDLVSTMIPNVSGKREGSAPVPLPSYEDMLMDPASALEQLSGVDEDELRQE